MCTVIQLRPIHRGHDIARCYVKAVRQIDVYVGSVQILQQMPDDIVRRHAACECFHWDACVLLQQCRLRSSDVTRRHAVCVWAFILTYLLTHLPSWLLAWATECWQPSTCLTLSPPTLLRLYTLPYWSNPPVLIFDIRTLWRSVLSARAPECQKLKLVG